MGLFFISIFLTVRGKIIVMKKIKSQTKKGIIKFNQIPNIYSFIGLTLIILGVLIVNLLDKS